MKTKLYLSTEEIKAMAHAAEREALEQGWKVSIAIVDDGGHLLHFFRLDGAAPMTAEMAVAKARASVLGRRESKEFEDIINQGRVALLSAPLQYGMLEGAVNVSVAGQCVGAIGVSGVKSSEDARVAAMGCAAVAAAVS